MEVRDIGLVLVIIVVGFVMGYIMSPEYVSLEESQRDNYETQLEYKDTVIENTISDWEAYAEDVKEYEQDSCVIEKKELTDRLAVRNQELLQVNADWQNVITDLNTTVADFNRVLHDFNSDVNCWR